MAVRPSHLCRAEVCPRHKRARVASTACAPPRTERFGADSLAQLWHCLGCSSFQVQAPSFQILIANGILESHLTSSKQTTAMPSNREKFWVPRTRKHALEVTSGREAKKRLTATDDPTRIGIPSDYQEPRELSSGLMRHQKPSTGNKAKKRLTATFTKLKIESTHSKNSTPHFSNRNKKRVSGNFPRGPHHIVRQVPPGSSSTLVREPSIEYGAP